MNLSPQAIKKQNIIFTSLRRYLQGDDLLQAMVIWQDKYAEKPGFSVRYFADDVAKLAGPHVKPKELVGHMVVALNTPKYPAEDATAALEQYRLRNGLNKESTLSTPELNAATVLLKKVADLTDPSIQRQIQMDVALAVSKAPIAPPLKTQILRWFDNSDYRFRAITFDIRDLRAVISLSYATYCDSLGPVKTDQLFAEALRRLESNGGAVYRDIFKQIM
ncbi:MAG TPA: hypothetical protein VIC26_11850 [Marinagarivorans sp.]